VGHPNGLVPRLREPRARHQLADLVPHEVGGRGRERRREALQSLRELRRHALRREGRDRLVGQRLHVDVFEDRRRDAVGQGLLHRGIGSERSDGLDELVGVGYLAAGPHRDERYGRQRAAEDEQHDGDHRPPANAPSRGARLGAQRRVLRAQPLELVAFVHGQLGSDVGWRDAAALCLGYLRYLRRVDDQSVVRRRDARLARCG
jgi:hypothetical protein